LAGVKWGSLAFAAQAIFSSLCAFVIPVAVRFTSLKAVYSFAQLWLAGCLIVPLFITEKWGAFCFLVALGEYSRFFNRCQNKISIFPFLFDKKSREM
jgi:hypothetical protein